LTDFDWSQVHDFDEQEAGRTEEDVEALVLAYESDLPEEPDK
jgi:hypothetical protein